MFSARFSVDQDDSSSPSRIFLRKVRAVVSATALASLKSGDGHQAGKNR